MSFYRHYPTFESSKDLIVVFRSIGPQRPISLAVVSAISTCSWAKGAELAPLFQWDVPGAPKRSAAELVSGLEATWQMIHTALVRWTPANLDDVFTEVQNEQSSRFTRQWIIWSSIKHDLHHGGEVSFTLGAHHLEAPDL